MSYHSPFPWTADGNKLRDKRGNAIAVFNDHRDADALVDLFDKLHELDAEIDHLRDKLHDAEEREAKSK